LPDAHLEVDFFQAAGRGSGSRGLSCPKFASDGKDDEREQDNWAGNSGRKTSGFWCTHDFL